MIKRIGKYKVTLLVIDVGVVMVSYVGAVLERFRHLMPVELAVAFTLATFAAFVFQNNSLYKVNIFLDRSASAALLIRSMLVIFASYLAFGFITRFTLIAPSRLTFFYFAGNSFAAFGVYRVLLLPSIFGTLSSQGIRKRKVVVIGTGDVAKEFASSVKDNKRLGIDILGFVDDALPPGTGILNSYQVLGDTLTLKSIVRTKSCDELVIAADDIPNTRLLSLMRQAKDTGASVKVVSSFFKTVGDATITESYTIHPVATITRGLYSPITIFYQRVSDYIAASIGLLVLSPLFLLAAAAIKATSRGPVFYRHKRVGKDGRVFNMYKFRSMYSDDKEDAKRKTMMLEFINGHDDGNGDCKVIDNSRVTPVGRLLRKSSFDELPQLINVLRGEMSLVGPRPVLPYEFEAMKEWHHERDKILPGCTGFWQVYGRGRTSFDNMVIMDIYMIENMSPWLYVQLVLKTVAALLLGRGAK